MTSPLQSYAFPDSLQRNVETDCKMILILERMNAEMR